MLPSLNLRMVPGLFGLARLPAAADIPDWINGPGFSAAIRADDELTIVCYQTRIPQDVQSDREWVCFRSIGPFAFDASGMVHALVAPLSTADIGIFVVCTFDGEHVLVPERKWGRSRLLLQEAGHRFLDGEAD